MENKIVDVNQNLLEICSHIKTQEFEIIQSIFHNINNFLVVFRNHQKKIKIYIHEFIY